MHPAKAALAEIVKLQRQYERKANSATKDMDRRIFSERADCFRYSAQKVRKAIKEMQKKTAELQDLEPPFGVFRNADDAKAFLSEFTKRMAGK